MRRCLWLVVGALALVAPAAGQRVGSASFVQFVFTSDAHYGLARRRFRGAVNVDARVVNEAMVAEMNGLGHATLPADGGVRAGEAVGPIDFVAEGGDVANREEARAAAPIQSAAASWTQFAADYLQGIRLRDRAGARTPVFVVPGNHDASNDIGFWRPMQPVADPSSLLAIYNLMMRPPVPLTATTFDYDRDRVVYSREVGGLHLVFLHIWPDSQVRAWMARDLAHVAPSTPVMVFTHDQPDVESKHFINPNGRHDVNPTDRFENLLADVFQDGSAIDAPSTVEQRAFERFVESHRNVIAYFHGNSNWNEFYDWRGPDHAVDLHTFRVDSPMKGKASSQDETRLSFQVATVDLRAQRMTVRECLWDSDPRDPRHPLAWGASRTVSIRPPAPTRRGT